MLRLNGLTEYWEGLSDKIWNVEDDCTTCDILIEKTLCFSRFFCVFERKRKYERNIKRVLL